MVTNVLPGARTDRNSSLDALLESKVMTEKLAIHGGPRAVTAPYREKWRKVRLKDGLRILRCVRADLNTEVGGGAVAAFEKRFAGLCKTRHGLVMNSGTAALHSAFFAVGVKQGTEVIVPSYTFPASATPIIALGGTPVFCDIDPETLTADPDDVERRITSKTRAICVVHVWGNPARLDRFAELAAKHGVALIEDCSHAHGAIYQGRPVGSWGDIGCFSLQGLKAVSGGECGIAVTNNDRLHDHMLLLGHYGRSTSAQAAGTFELDNLSVGHKYRVHLYGVLLASGSLARLDELNVLRRRNYKRLADGLADCPAIAPIQTYPDAIRGGLLEFIFKFVPDKAGGWNRGAFVNAVKAEGVPMYADRYTMLGKTGRTLHELPVFRLDSEEFGGCLGRAQGNIGDEHLPVTEALSDCLVGLPPFTMVKEAFLDQCIKAIRKVASAAAEMTDLRA